MNLHLDLQRTRRRDSPWTAVALAVVMAAPGVGMIGAAFAEGFRSEAGPLAWVGLLGLPFALALFVPVALVAVRPEGRGQGRIWNLLRAVLGVGLLAGLLTLAGGEMFADPNRNGVVLGSLLLGGAVGVLLAQGWSRGPADG